MIRNLLICFGSLALLGSSLRSDAALLGTYTFTGNDPAGDATVPAAVANMTFGSFSRVNLTARNDNNQFSSSAWNLATSIDTSEYVQFVVTPDSTHALSLTSITFNNDVNGGGGGGPLFGRVEIFLGPGLTSMGSLNYTPTTANSSVNFDFTDFTTGVGEAATIRFYGWDAGGAGGHLELDNVAVNGVVVVPEPTSVALALFAISAVGIGITRRIYAKARA